MPAYYGVIHKTPESSYGISFPDLPGCISAADSLEELEALGREALALHLEGMREDGEAIPAPSSFQIIHNEVKSDEDFAGITLISIPAKVRRIRANLSLSDLELEIIDRAAAERGMERSAFLAAAAKAVASGECTL